MVVQKVLSLRQQQAPSRQINILGSCCHWLDESFTVRVTESGPKPRKHSIKLPQVKEIMLFFCRLEVCKLGMEMNFWLTVSNNMDSARVC